MVLLDDYRKVVGDEIIDEIINKAKRLHGKHVVFINSTYEGGGVAEILNTLIPLFNMNGISVGWRVLRGNADFFTVTKKFHNAMQGGKINLSRNKKGLYIETNKNFSLFTHLNHDLVVINDPQPLPLIDMYKKTQPWVLWCHVDMTNPNPSLWKYLKGFVGKYDEMVISNNGYKRPDLKIPQTVIYPAIDPLATKNKPISRRTVNSYLRKFGIKQDKPIISQVSRFDKWKDPLGVVKVFELVRKKKDCRLVLLGSMASDDPEGQQIYEKVERYVEKSPYKDDIQLVLFESDILVNALQRASSVVIQKSSREGFGLVVSEALFKGTPVVASRVGGIPLQVLDGVNGFLHRPTDNRGFARSVLRLLEDDELRERLGRAGKLHVRDNFLMTRLMFDWLTIFERQLTKKKK